MFYENVLFFGWMADFTDSKIQNAGFHHGKVKHQIG